MRVFPILLSAFVLTFVSCSESSGDVASENSTLTEVDDRFQSCYFEDNLAQNRCDSVLQDFFGSEIFKRHIRFDKSESFINCQSADKIEMKSFGDTECCLPNTYDMVYTIRENGQKIYEFPMVSGSDMEFEHVSTQSGAQLIGYKKLLAGEFQITYAEARAIAKKNGCTDEMILELVYDEKGKANDAKSYFWEIEQALAQDKTVLVQIDPFSGSITRHDLMVIAGD